MLSLSNQDKEKEYSDLTDALQFIFGQMVKGLQISIPGIIESYDQEKKRCRVRPAINIRKTDGSTFQPSPIVNVPVVWPSGGGFTILAPLPEGEPVDIRFSQRGITQFKELFSQSDPGDGIFAKEDAVVYAGYGALEVTPATSSGMSMQDDAGENYLYVEDGLVKVKAATKITMDSPVVDFTGNINMISGTIGGPNVFNGASGHEHRHPQGNDSDNDTQQDVGAPKV